jgi:hypothetical protein
MAVAAIPYIVMAVAAATAAGATVYSETQQAKMANKQADMQSQQDIYNAKVAENNAALAQQQSERQAEQLKANKERIIGQQVNAAAASGLQISGSVLDVMTDTDMEANRDIAMSLYQGKMEAYNYGQQAASYRLDSERAIWLGKEQAKAHNTAAWVAGLTGAAQVASAIGQASAASSARTANNAPGMPTSGTAAQTNVGSSFSMLGSTPPPIASAYSGGGGATSGYASFVTQQYRYPKV